MALPTGYTQVEYIETTGTQYIDTGFKPNQNTRVVVDFRASAANRHVFGARTSFPNNSFVLFWVSNASYCIQVNNSTFNGGSFDTSARCTVDMTASAFKINGVTKATYSVSAFQTAYNLYIASCTNSSESENMPGRYYSCQVYDNGRLIRDYVPCRNSSNEAGMYDQANGVFYRNAGSGTFGVGAVVEGGITGGGADPANFTVNARVTVGGVGKKLTNGYVVVDGALKQILRAYVYMNGALVSLNELKSLLPTGYTQVEYIESSGTQYINTGVILSRETVIDVSVRFDSSPSYADAILGSTPVRLYYLSGYGFVFENNNASGAKLVQNMPGKYDINVKVANDALTINGTTAVTNNSPSVSASYPMYLFANNAQGSIQYPASIKLYSCRVYSGTTIIRDFVPCIDPSGTVGVYDVVNEKMYKNAGSGTFAAGEAV